MKILMKVAALAATTVVLTSSVATAGTVSVFGDRFNLNTINNFYDGLDDHSSSILGDITGDALAGTDLLWAVQPANAYTTAEVDAMNVFLQDGGRIAFMGEHGNFAPAENNRISNTIEELGGTMSIINDVLDGGFQFATRDDGQIQDDPLNEGVNNYEYAAYAPINIGSATNLMFGADLTTSMMALENVGEGSIFLITDQNVWDRVGSTSNDNARMFENLIDGDTSNPNNPQPSPVPLPAAGWMLLAALGGMAGWKSRKSV